MPGYSPLLRHLSQIKLIFGFDRSHAAVSGLKNIPRVFPIFVHTIFFAWWRTILAMVFKLPHDFGAQHHFSHNTAFYSIVHRRYFTRSLLLIQMNSHQFLFFFLYCSSGVREEFINISSFCTPPNSEAPKSSIDNDNQAPLYLGFQFWCVSSIISSFNPYF